MSGINLGGLNHKELTEIVKFDSSPVINAVWRSLAVHCHTEWWGVVSLGMVTVKRLTGWYNSFIVDNSLVFKKYHYLKRGTLTRYIY